jgi:hypothetical protein
MLDEKTGSYPQQIRESMWYDEMVRDLGEQEANGSLNNFVSRLGECRRAIPRADIWIYRPTGGVCREKRLTMCGLMKKIAADFRFPKLGAAGYTAP